LAPRCQLAAVTPSASTTTYLHNTCHTPSGTAGQSVAGRTLYSWQIAVWLVTGLQHCPAGHLDCLQQLPQPQHA
jgi:hypothetical protein